MLATNPFCEKLHIYVAFLLINQFYFYSCLHVGLSPDLQSMEQIRRIMRPTDVPDQGLLCDLLWSDPDKETMGWGENDRGVSFTFGAEVVAKFLHKHDLDLICRAHQVSTNYLFLGKSRDIAFHNHGNVLHVLGISTVIRTDSRMYSYNIVGCFLFCFFFPCTEQNVISKACPFPSLVF